jgi:putative transposase
MARRQRIHKAYSTYHVMLRGNNGQKIYVNKNDFSKLSLLIQEGTERYGHDVLAFCFMENHIHLVVRVKDTSLSKIMQNIAFRYARFMNKNYQKIGHLFQGRFKSILVDDTNYLLELVRYVHLNPVRARMVENPEEYFWSGHRSYIGKDGFLWVSKERVLGRFKNKKHSEEIEYEKFIYRGIGQELEIDFNNGNQKGLDVLGTDCFTERLILEKPKIQTYQVCTKDLVEVVCEYFDTTLQEVGSRRRDRKSSRIRGMISYITRESKGCFLSELVELLNRKSHSLSELARVVETRMKTELTIATEIEEIFLLLEMKFKKSA